MSAHLEIAHSSGGQGGHLPVKRNALHLTMRTWNNKAIHYWWQQIVNDSDP